MPLDLNLVYKVSRSALWNCLGSFGDLWELSGCPHPQECLNLKAEPIKAVCRILGLGLQLLGERQPQAQRRGEETHIPNQ